ncbi:MAG: hypothetical protein Kow0042_21250 [Calditrichia bacterium]
MQNKSTTLFQTDYSEAQLIEYYENLISFIRGRLNVIGTSIYLLQSGLEVTDFENRKYLQKINDELDSIRKLINE